MRENGYQDTGPRPRGTCSVCGADVALRRNGTPREHRGSDGTRVCPGSGQEAANG
jgi:hypothetical protein